MLNNFELPFPFGKWGAGFVSRYDGGARGFGYIRVFNRENGGPFTLGLLKQEVDLLNCPVFEARIRSDRPLPLNLYLKLPNSYQNIRLEMFRGTGDWETVLIDLSPYLRPGVPVTFAGITSGGWQGIPRGEHYDLDSVRFSKVISPARLPRFSGWDCSGSVTMLVGSTATPDTPVESFRLPADLRGLARIYWMATDSRGNATPVYRETLLLDPQPPRVSGVERNGSEISFEIEDDHAFVLSSVSILLENGLAYNLRKGLELGLRRFSFTLPDDGEHTVRIFASDYAGNNMEHSFVVEGGLPNELEQEEGGEPAPTEE
jgi:hypothetical protein